MSISAIAVSWLRFAPHVVERGTNIQHLLVLVAAGTGIAHLALSARTPRDGGVVFVPLTGEHSQIVLTWPWRRAHPALDSLTGVIRGVVRGLDPDG